MRGVRGAPVLLIPQAPILRGLACLSCGAKFRPEQEGLWERHSVACSAAHEEEERQMSLRTTMGAFGGEMVVPDLEQWVRKHRVELIERRKRI